MWSRTPALLRPSKCFLTTTKRRFLFRSCASISATRAKSSGPITPRGSFAPGSPVMDGYRIAQQNCYRCHNMGAEGGHMASVAWPVLAAMAKGSPEFFAKYVRNPQVLNPHSRMAASPEYDDQTIAALRAYFATFAPGEQK